MAEHTSESLHSQVTADECADLILGGRYGPLEITDKIGATCDLLRIIGNCWWVFSNQPSCLGFSQFEIIYYHKVRGKLPMCACKVHFLTASHKDVTITAYPFISPQSIVCPREGPLCPSSLSSFSFRTAVGHVGERRGRNRREVK